MASGSRPSTPTVGIWTSRLTQRGCQKLTSSAIGDGWTWPYLPCDPQTAGNVCTACGVEVIPANYLFSRAGRIFAIEHGGDALEREIVQARSGLSGGDSK